MKTSASGPVGRSRASAMVSASVFLLFANAALLAEGAVQGGLTTAETILVDDNAAGYATFQSHNQKVVSNKNGIFMTHLHSRNESFTAQRWRLSRSKDGGKSFSTVYESTDATNPPCMETDEAGNLFLARTDFKGADAYLYRFLAEKNYTEPLIASIPGASADKYAMVLDLSKRLIYYHPRHFFYVLTLDGEIKNRVAVLRHGDNARIMYPLLSLAPDGVLHTAWTTQRHEKYLYWDIHYLATRDSGNTWRRFDGSLVSIPVKDDNSCPTDCISLADEYGSHHWLANLMVKDGKLHFMYASEISSVNRQHYVRYDLKSGKRDINLYPDFQGKALTIRSLDGFFATRSSLANAPLYCIGNCQGRIGCVASDDNGATWYDYALSQQAFVPYSIGGCREISAEGSILGSFTDQRDPPGKVFFLRIKAGLTSARIFKSNYARGTFSAQFTDVRGQPENIHFSADGKNWSGWQAFSTNLNVSLAVRPRYFQLRSRMAVESEVFAASGPDANAR